MGSCNCGANKAGGVQKWKVVDASGATIATYDSEADARMFSAKTPGSRVRRA